MNTHPRISVIMPVFNAEKYVRQALESVLAQTVDDTEIICVDDGSTDSSLDIMRAFGNKITILGNNQNTGAAQARNTGIASARGEFLAFLDADDIWEPEKLSAQMLQFQNSPELDISFSYMKCFISPELSEEIKQLRHCPPDPMAGYVPGTAIIKSTSFKKVGMLKPKWKVGEFIDWFARAKEMGLRYEMNPGVFLLRRIHETNTGVTERSRLTDYAKIIKESLDRKRSQT